VLAQDPYILPPRLTLDQAAASDATLATLLIGVAVGAIVLVPSLVYLYRLVLAGRLQHEFEPLDQRFRPMTAGDPDAEAPR
jgi:cytochrome bd-type quinol oxidase subunit 2